MFKKLILVGTILLTSAHLYAADVTPPKITSLDELNTMINGYVYKKDVNELTAIADYLSYSNALNKKTQFPMLGFFMGIKHENPKMFQTLRQKPYEPNMKHLLSEAENVSETMERFLNDEVNQHQETADFLNTLWGYFYATGDKRVLNKMCILQSTGTAMFQIRTGIAYEANKSKFPDLIKDCQ